MWDDRTNYYEQRRPEHPLAEEVCRIEGKLVVVIPNEGEANPPSEELVDMEALDESTSFFQLVRSTHSLPFFE